MPEYLAADQQLKQRVGTGNQDGPERGPGGGGRAVPEGETQHRADGGVIYPVQHMEAGGMIASPYANPMKQQMGHLLNMAAYSQMTRGPHGRRRWYVPKHAAAVWSADDSNAVFAFEGIQ